MKTISISKSAYLEGIRCSRLFWLRVIHPDLAAPVDTKIEYLFEQGHLVGVLARKLFQDGTLIGGSRFKPFESLLAVTQAAIVAGNQCLFEATFETAHMLRCRPDILYRSSNAPWDIGEVKMCTALKPSHLDDVAFQTHCLLRSGQEVGRKFLIHVNREYMRNGDVNLQGLFVAQELTEDVNAEVKNIPHKVEKLVDLIVPFRSGDYTDHRFEGSASLKKVLPVLVPALSYDNLSIQDGDEASLLFQKYAEGQMTQNGWTAARSDLLVYCELDTLAMVEILHVLQSLE